MADKYRTTRAAGSDAAASQDDCSPARAELRFGDSHLCDSNNDRGRVAVFCGSLIDDGAQA